ncbi:MAG: serine hydrolase [Burkholderiales bacterium]|nr:serine hydrolase [Anaerolineae bacterium]
MGNLSGSHDFTRIRRTIESCRRLKKDMTKLRLLFLFLFMTLGLGITTTAAQEVSTFEPVLSLLWNQVRMQPDDFSIGCMPLDAPVYSFLYNADDTFPLASISKLLIFIEVARRIDIGAISEDETVDVETLNRYNLPRTDRGAHDRFMEQYPPDVQAIPLLELAVGMIQYSSNAASDYLLDRLVSVNWDSLYQRLSLTSTTYPHSLTMIPLLMNNHETGKVTMADVASLSTTQGERFLDLYIEDELWRQDEIDYRSELRSQFPSWDVQAAILEQHTATGTVNDFLKVLMAIYGEGDALSTDVKMMTRTALRWEDSPFISDHYLEYGSKLGFYSGGTLTLLAYGYPYDGAPVISATFLRNIPQRTYRELLQQDAIGELAHWMNFNGCVGLREAITSED